MQAKGKTHQFSLTKIFLLECEEISNYEWIQVSPLTNRSGQHTSLPSLNKPQSHSIETLIGCKFSHIYLLLQNFFWLSDINSVQPFDS